MRIFLLTLLTVLFAGAAANAQPMDMPGNDKTDKDAEQRDRSAGLGVSRGRSDRSDRSKDKSEEDEERKERKERDRDDHLPV